MMREIFFILANVLGTILLVLSVIWTVLFPAQITGRCPAVEEDSTYVLESKGNKLFACEFSPVPSGQSRLFWIESENYRVSLYLRVKGDVYEDLTFSLEKIGETGNNELRHGRNETPYAFSTFTKDSVGLVVTDVKETSDYLYSDGKKWPDYSYRISEYCKRPYEFDKELQLMESGREICGSQDGFDPEKGDGLRYGTWQQFQGPVIKSRMTRAGQPQYAFYDIPMEFKNRRALMDSQVQWTINDTSLMFLFKSDKEHCIYCVVEMTGRPYVKRIIQANSGEITEYTYNHYSNLIILATRSEDMCKICYYDPDHGYLTKIETTEKDRSDTYNEVIFDIDKEYAVKDTANQELTDVTDKCAPPDIVAVLCKDNDSSLSCRYKETSGYRKYTFAVDHGTHRSEIEMSDVGRIDNYFSVTGITVNQLNPENYPEDELFRTKSYGFSRGLLYSVNSDICKTDDYYSRDNRKYWRYVFNSASYSSRKDFQLVSVEQASAYFENNFDAMSTPHWIEEEKLVFKGPKIKSDKVIFGLPDYKLYNYPQKTRGSRILSRSEISWALTDSTMFITFSPNANQCYYIDFSLDSVPILRHMTEKSKGKLIEYAFDFDGNLKVMASVVDKKTEIYYYDSEGGMLIKKEIAIREDQDSYRQIIYDTDKEYSVKYCGD